MKPNRSLFGKATERPASDPCCDYCRTQAERLITLGKGDDRSRLCAECVQAILQTEAERRAEQGL